MKKTSKYFFSALLLCLVSCSLYSQSYRVKGLRLGVDVSRFSLYYVDPDREAYEFSADFEVKKDIYLTAEYGMQTVKLEKDFFNYYSEGNYFRVGADRNFLKSDNPENYEMAFLGIRYGFSNLNHSATNIIIPGNYWGNTGEINITENSYTTHWMEIAGGIRAELFRNVFIGWSVRARIRLAHTKDQYMDPYNIPGYGNGSKKGNVGFNFSLYYKIPIYKKTVAYKAPIK
jgi:hypothetical protein